MKGRLKKITALILICTLSMSMAGCGKSADTSLGTSSDEAVFYGSYSIDLNLLIPYYLPDTTGKKIVANTMDGLITNDRFGRYIGAMADTWEANEDKSVWTFHIREGAMWYDNNGKEIRPVTASDYVDGMRYYADHKNSKADISMIKNVIEGLDKYYSDLQTKDDTSVPDYRKPEDLKVDRQVLVDRFDDIVGVKALDEHTVQYTLTQSCPYFESFLVTELFLPINYNFAMECGKRYGTDVEFLQYTGPYYLSEWRTGVQFVMNKNPLYHSADDISMEKLVLKKISNTNTTIEMFQRHELTSANIPGNEVDNYLKDDKLSKYVTFKDKSSVVFWFYINFESINPEWNAFVQNDDFRKAMRYALDRKTLASIFNSVNPEDMLCNTIVPEGVCFDENGTDYTDYPELKEIKDLSENTYDPKLAKEYFQKSLNELTEADGTIKGVSPGTIDMKNSLKFDVDGKLPLEVVYTHGPANGDIQGAQVLKATLENIFGTENINVLFYQTGDDKYTSCNQYGGFDISYDSFSFKYCDPYAQLGRLCATGEVNDGKFAVDAYEALLEEGSSKIVLSERYEAFAKAEAILINGGYIIPWENGGGVFCMTRLIPFLAPRGGFGLSRFSYRGTKLSEEPITQEDYDKFEKEFYEELNSLKQ